MNTSGVRLERERSHFNEIARQLSDSTALKMPESNIRRYDHPREDTVYPLEYAFYLLGELEKRHVLALGCGDGLDVVILASLGANVTAVDISDESLNLGAARARANGVQDRIRFVHADAAHLKEIGNETMDKAHCAAILHHVDIPAAARELRRVIKPGGAAVFLEPMLGPFIWQSTKKWLPTNPGVSDDERPLSLEDVEMVNRTIGDRGKQKAFGLTARLLTRMGWNNPAMVDVSHRLDGWILARSEFAREFASPLVWSAVRT